MAVDAIGVDSADCKVVSTGSERARGVRGGRRIADGNYGALVLRRSIFVKIDFITLDFAGGEW